MHSTHEELWSVQGQKAGIGARCPRQLLYHLQRN